MATEKFRTPLPGRLGLMDEPPPREGGMLSSSPSPSPDVIAGSKSEAWAWRSLPSSFGSCPTDGSQWLTTVLEVEALSGRDACCGVLVRIPLDGRAMIIFEHELEAANKSLPSFELATKPAMGLAGLRGGDGWRVTVMVSGTYLLGGPRLEASKRLLL